MFNNQQDDQTQNNTDIDHVAQDIAAPAPAFGLGGANPASFSPVLPPQPDPSATAPEPAAVTPAVDPVQSQTPIAITPSPATPAAAPGDLEEIKNQALQQLSPLVSKLDQSPEERYKTLMMMIQASDNHELINEAYAAANAITDETFKAEALLGIVNEINYFTQRHNGDQSN